MDRYLGYAAVFVLLVAAVWLFYLQVRPIDDSISVHEDPAFYVALNESNAVIVRVLYPFSDARGVLDAAFLAIEVLTYKQKAVFFQQVDGNKCVQTVFVPGVVSEQNAPEMNTFSADQCLLMSKYYPTIEVAEGDYAINESPLMAKLTGKYPHFGDVMRFFLRKVYPDTDEIVANIKSLLSKRR
jgi:hypothetical protein